MTNDPKFCKCGCGEKVIGIRSSKIFVNSQHNHAYFHRKEKLKPSINLCACGCNQVCKYRFIKGHKPKLILTEEQHKQKSELAKQTYIDHPELRKSRSDDRKRDWENTEYRKNIEEKNSKSVKALWNNPEYREKEDKTRKLQSQLFSDNAKNNGQYQK